METISVDPCMVAGTVVAARFGDRGTVIRRGFEDHPKVQRWRVKHHNPEYRVEPQFAFEALLREAIQW